MTSYPFFSISVFFKSRILKLPLRIDFGFLFFLSQSLFIPSFLNCLMSLINYQFYLQISRVEYFSSLLSFTFLGLYLLPSRFYHALSHYCTHTLRHTLTLFLSLHSGDTGLDDKVREKATVQPTVYIFFMAHARPRPWQWQWHPRLPCHCIHHSQQCRLWLLQNGQPPRPPHIIQLSFSQSMRCCCLAHLTRVSSVVTFPVKAMARLPMWTCPPLRRQPTDRGLVID